MSTYKFNINKRHIVAATDSSQFAATIPETHPDAETEALAQRDIDVSIYLDDVLKHTVTLTDAGATLQFDADITAGDHTIKICAPKDPIQQTDICVDQFLIGDTVCVASQWDFNNQVFGTTSTLRQKIAPHNAQPHDYVWYGHVVHNDSSLNLPGVFYRAGIVSDHQAEWHFDFTKTADGKIWMNNPGDTDHILWDSTAQHTYLFVAQGPDQTSVDAAYETYTSQEILNFQTNDSSTTTTTRFEANIATYDGPGTYQIDGDNFFRLSNTSIDEASEDENSIVFVTLSQLLDASKQHWYHRNYTVTPIIVT